MKVLIKCPHCLKRVALVDAQLVIETCPKEEDANKVLEYYKNPSDDKWLGPPYKSTSEGKKEE